MNGEKSVQDAMPARDRVSYEWEIDTLNLIFINNLRSIRYVKYKDVFVDIVCKQCLNA